MAMTGKILNHVLKKFMNRLKLTQGTPEFKMELPNGELYDMTRIQFT